MVVTVGGVVGACYFNTRRYSSRTAVVVVGTGEKGYDSLLLVTMYATY